MIDETRDNPSRRTFAKATTTAAIGGVLASAIAKKAYAGGDDLLRVGLVGCGGRGTGAASEALRADKNVKLVAMADAFKDRLEGSLKHIKSEDIADKVAVDPDHQFVGFDAYQKLIASGVDVVLLCTSPHFRPLHLKACIDAGKHVFVEKPVAVDAPGVRSILATCEEAKKKNLSVVSGLCYRYELPKRETFARIHDGTIGKIIAMQTSYNVSGLWKHTRKPEWSDMEWQMRNWLYFTWLSGDMINEQHIHSLDKMAWAMQQYPIKATSLGGRQTRTAPEYGHIFDHFATTYEFEGGVKCFSTCRQQDGCVSDVSDHVFGSKGTAIIQDHIITGENAWRSKSKSDMYQSEHNEFFASIRAGKPINNGEYMAHSTLMAIMGRMAAYTGKTITWEQALNSKEDLTPLKYEWGSMPVPAVAVPGVTKFV